MEAKKTYKSFQYRSRVVWKTGREGVMSGPGHPSIVVGSPPEFKGKPDVLPPEELLVGSVNTCLMLTFLAYAENRKLEFDSYESDAEGLLEHTGGKYRVTQITVRPKLKLKRASDEELARELLASAKEGCFVSNSLTSTVTITPEIQAD